MKFINKIFFITPEVGWIAGTNELSNDLNGRVAFVLRTTDGGRSWKSCQIPTKSGVADIQDLFFLNASDGWLITWHFNNEGTHLFQTTDGGKTWLLHPDQTIQGQGRWLSVVRFLNSKVGFAFNRDDQVDAAVEPPAIGVVANADDWFHRLGKATLHGRRRRALAIQPTWRVGWRDCKCCSGRKPGCAASPKMKPGFWLLHIRMRNETK